MIIAVTYTTFIIGTRKPEKNSGLVSQRSRVRIPYLPEFFCFRLSFRNCKSCVYNCHDHPSFNSSLRSSHIWFSYIQDFIKKKHSCTLLVVLIINNYWTRLSEILWFVYGEHINLWRSQRMRQIIDLRDTDKSRYFVITEFYNCFIIRSPSVFFFF